MRPLYPGKKWPGHEASHLVLKLRIGTVIPPRALYAFMYGQGQLYLFSCEMAEGYDFINF